MIKLPNDENIPKPIDQGGQLHRYFTNKFKPLNEQTDQNATSIACQNDQNIPKTPKITMKTFC